MKSIYLLMIKKRWYLFFLLALLVFLMNFFLWNEASQLIRAYPMIQTMKVEAEKGSYETVYTPSASSAGLVTEPTKEEREQLFRVLLPYVDHLSEQKLKYFHDGQLAPLTDRRLREALLGEELSPIFLDDLLLQGLKEQDYQQLEEELGTLGFPLALRPLVTTYQAQKSYYVGNLVFGAGLSLLLFLFGSLVLLWLIRASCRICQEEMRVLRLIGLTQKSLAWSVKGLFLAPIFLGILGFCSLVGVMGVGFVPFDLPYLFLINGLLSCLAGLATSSRVKGVFL